MLARGVEIVKACPGEAAGAAGDPTRHRLLSGSYIDDFNRHKRRGGAGAGLFDTEAGVDGGEGDPARKRPSASAT